MKLEEEAQIAEMLKEILKWVKFDGIQRAREIVTSMLKKDSEKMVYHYSDGRGSAEIARLAGISDFAVRSYWKKWAILGIVKDSEKYKGRYEHVFSLEEFGIELPLLKKIESEKSEEESKKAKLSSTVEGG